MITRYAQQSTIWIDLFQPSPEEIRAVMNEYAIDLTLMGDLTSPTRRADIASAQDAIKVSLNFPIVKLIEWEHPQEIKFLITKKALISVRYGDIAPLNQFAKELEVVTTLHKTKKTMHGGHMFAAIMNALYTALGQKLEYIEARLVDIEEEIFKEHEKEMVVEISHVSQRLIMFGQTLTAHEHVLTRLHDQFKELFGEPLGAAIADLEMTFRHLGHQLSALRATTTELRETNNALLTTKQNEIMKTLTIMALITFPLTLLSSIFGMNTKSLPIVGMRGDFWIVISIMLGTACLLFIFFRRRRWM